MCSWLQVDVCIWPEYIWHLLDELWYALLHVPFLVISVKRVFNLTLSWKPSQQLTFDEIHRLYINWHAKYSGIEALLIEMHFFTRKISLNSLNSIHPPPIKKREESYHYTSIIILFTWWILKVLIPKGGYKNLFMVKFYSLSLSIL